MSQLEVSSVPLMESPPLTDLLDPLSSTEALSPLLGDADGEREPDGSRRIGDKVRIYDLAREMGRDNKDVLEVCNQLEIPYKSHSSTITGEQAEQIRASLASQPSARTSARPQPKPPVIKAAPPDRNQQILNVRPPVTERVSVARPPQDSVVPKDPQAIQPSRVPTSPAQPPSSLVSPPRRAREPVVAPHPPAARIREADADSDPTPAFETASPVETLPLEAAPPVNAASERLAPASPPARQPAPLARRPSIPEGTPPTTESSAPPTRAARPERDRVLRPPTEPRSREEGREPQAPVERPVAQRPTPLPAPTRNSDPAPTRNSDSPIRTGDAPIPVRTGDAPTRTGSAPVPRPRAGDPVRPSRSAEPAPVRPQLVGAPVRPGTRVENRVAATTPSPITPRREGSEGGGGDVLRPIRLKTDLLGAPTRTAKDGSEVPRPNLVLADAPVRPTARIKQRDDREEEDDEQAALRRTGARTQTKRKRSRRRTEGEVELDVEASPALTLAKLAELEALKPLPRPTAKPPSTGKPPTAVPASKIKVQPLSRQRRGPAAEVTAPVEVEPDNKLLTLDGDLTVADLSSRMRIPQTEIIKAFFLKGTMVTVNQLLDQDTAIKLATEMGYTIERKVAESKAIKTEMLDIADVDHLVLRPPVVTIMGHVDHGKTTLLDAIRDTKVVDGEAGGITQRIGAYHVDVQHEGKPRRVVFLDTPGHEAFTAMRARGAKVTDIAVLVVAADDGVQPQTIEAISHAKAAKVPIVVAVNKVDKPDSQPERIKQQLSEHGLVPEEWGGDTPMVDVSAQARLHLDELLEMILLVAEVGELQANPERLAKGTVVEANLDKARGPVATLLVQNGTLRIGDPVVAGSVFGRVKAMIDDRGERLLEAGPSSAVQLLGLNEVPSAGDEFEVYATEREARQVADTRAQEQRQIRLQQTMLSRRVSLGSLSAKAQEGQLKELNLVIKTDNQGSAEALVASLQQLSHSEVQVRILMASPGEITETDVDLAAASDAIIMGFTTTVSPGTRQLADRYGVDIREYDIIYALLADVTGAMEGLLDPELVEEPLGQVEVRMVITIGKGSIAGSYVQSGKIVRNAFLRVKRRNELVYEGRLDSLKRFKDDVREVASGFECGIGVDKFNGWQEGDIVEVYQMVSKRRTLTLNEPAKR